MRRFWTWLWGGCEHEWAKIRRVEEVLDWYEYYTEGRCTKCNKVKRF